MYDRVDEPHNVHAFHMGLWVDLWHSSVADIEHLNERDPLKHKVNVIKGLESTENRVNVHGSYLE
jgi:hypothetical protein